MTNATEQLEKGKILPLVFRLTIPAVIAQLITFLYNVVDRMMLAVVGVVIGAITFGLAEPVVRAFGCPESAVGFATDYLKIYAIGTVFVTLSQGLNPFITAQGYALTAMLSVLIGALLNIALDPLFIFALNMGVKGASLATVLSQAVSFVWIMLFLFSKKNGLRLNVKNMRPEKARVFSVLSLGISPFIMTITECAIQIVFNVNLNASTGGDSNYTAALTIMLSALQLISLPLNGLGYGMQPFVSYNYGKGDAKRLKTGIRYVTAIAFAFTLIVWSASMLFPEIYAYAFSASDEVTAIVVAYAPSFLMGSIMFFVQMTLQNTNVALGQAKSALIIAVFRKVIVLIPLCFTLTHFMGFAGVYLSEGLADLLAGVVTAVTLSITFPKVIDKREREVAPLNPNLR